jgi:hypothetical protein
MSMFARCGVSAVALVCSWLMVAPAEAGPPFVTDDPQPTDAGHWEIYNFVAGGPVGAVMTGQAGLDLNYGAHDNLQLTAVLPVAFESDDDTRAGLGNVELAVKYRFLRQSPDSITPDVAVFPRLFLPAGTRGLGSDRTSLLLPIWAEKDFGRWSVFGGGGYDINPGPANRNFWISGAVLTYAVNDRLSVGAEVYNQSPDAAEAKPFTGVNLGVTYKLVDHWSLLAAGGPGVQNAASQGRYDFYLALKADY